MLQSPLPVAVANPSSQLTATGVMQVPIIWENGRPSIFSMLVVPGLAWQILFGQNHLRKTQAHTNHAARQVYFADPQLNFTVKCRDANPLDAFPSLRSQPSSSASQGYPSTHVTCLLTAMPTPSHHSSHIWFHHGFNLVTLCLMMTASLVGSAMFSSPHWLEGNEISPGVQVVSGPVDLNPISSVPSLDDPLFRHYEGHNYPKCRPSHMLLEYEPLLVQAGVLISPTQPLGTGNAFNTGDAPKFSQKFFTLLLWSSPQGITLSYPTMQIWVLFSQCLLIIMKIFLKQLIIQSAHTLADTWLEYAKHTNAAQHSKPVARSQAQPSGTSSSPRSWSLHAQITEMAQAGLNFSILSPFLPEPDLDPPHIFPPVENVGLDPHSEEYFQKLVTALDLETENYAHVDPGIMKQFKELICKNSHAFYLPGSELSTMTGFHHNIPAGDSPPVYHLPYWKSPSELAAIKDELQKMLKLHIIKPSFPPEELPVFWFRNPQ